MTGAGEPGDLTAEMGERLVSLRFAESEQDGAAATAQDAIDHVPCVNIGCVAAGGESECVSDVAFQVGDRETPVGEALGGGLEADRVESGGEVAGTGDPGWFDDCGVVWVSTPMMPIFNLWASVRVWSRDALSQPTQDPVVTVR